MKYQLVGSTLGILLMILGASEFIPAFVELASQGDNAGAFFLSAIVGIFFGGALFLANRRYEYGFTVREAFLLTAISWAGMSIFASLPLYLSHLNLSYTDALFESVSGITTTGSTILTGLDSMSHGLLLWRSMIQWMGGIGIIGFAIVFLPFLKVGGMQLFQTESSDRSEKIMPRTREIAFSLVQVYIIITALCCIAYKVLGMGWFDAVNHALTTISTGGYSTHDASAGFFDSYGLHMAMTFFMLLGGLPFVLYVKLIFQGKFAFFSDDQFKWLMSMLLVFTVLMTGWLFFTSSYGLADSFRHVVFNLVSVITTTGYASTDYTLWGPFATIIFFFITYLGACAGSTSGGIKIMRLVILAKTMGKQVKTLLYPQGIFVLQYQNKTVEHYVILTVLGFLCLYVVSNTFLTVLLTMTGLDFTTAISAAATAIANVGPGIGDVIGPAGNFSSIPDTAKWILCFGMLLGRLEILTIAVLFNFEFWRG